MNQSLLSKVPYNLWIIAGMFLLAIVLGILNNFRVYEEQRVDILDAFPNDEAEFETTP